MKIPDNIVDEIRTQVNIVDVIGDYIALEKRGRNYFACCPFHQEDTPSFSVSEEKQMFYCFGCHEGGNVFNFPMKYEGMNFQEAVLYVAKYTNVDFSQLQGLDTSMPKSPNQAYYDLIKFVSEFYQYLLQTDKGKIAKQYLMSRGITADEIAQFQIGFAPNEQLLGQLLEEKGFSLEKARELGLLFESTDMTNYYDAFRGRIVFPIMDNFGNIVAFTGRILTEYEHDDTPKYFHSPESKIFKKREVLYNYWTAKNEIKKQKEVFICEGIFDVIALARADVKNAVCTLGTAVTLEQMQFIKKMQLQPIFVFDNDNAGKHAVIKAMEMGLQHGVEAEAVTFWEYGEKDLDEFIANFDATKLKQLTQSRLSTFDYFIKFYEHTLNLENNDDRQMFMRKLVDALAKSNQATKEFYYNKILTITGYSRKVLEDFVTVEPVHDYEQTQNYPTYNKKSTTFNQYIPSLPKMTRQERCELLVIKGLCSGAAYIKAYQNKPILSQNMVFRKLIYEMLEDFRMRGKIDVSGLMGKLNQTEITFLTKSIYLEEPMNLTVFQELLDTLKIEAEREYLKDAATSERIDDKQKKIDSIQQYLEFKKKSIKS